MSFGEAEEGLADDPTSQLYKGAKSSHDLLQNDKRLRREVAAEEAPSPLSTSLGGARGKSASNGDGAGEDGQARKKRKKGEKEESGEVDLATLREQHALSKEKDGWVFFFLCYLARIALRDVNLSLFTMFALTI